jgi:hypothetical protein
MQDTQDIHARLKKKQPVTEQEFVSFLENNKHALFAFLIENTAGNINDTLRHKLGYSFELGFAPDKLKLASIINKLIDKDDNKELEAVLSNFKLKEEKLSPVLIQELKNTFTHTL